MDTRLTPARVKPCMGLKSDGHQINTVSHWLYFGLIPDGQRTNTRQTLYRNLLNTVCMYNKVIPNRHQVFTRRRPDEYVTDTGRIQETQEGQSMDKNWFDTVTGWKPDVHCTDTRWTLDRQRMVATLVMVMLDRYAES